MVNLRLFIGDREPENEEKPFMQVCVFRISFRRPAGTGRRFRPNFLSLFKRIEFSVANPPI